MLFRSCLTEGERLRANLVAENPDALYFVGITSNAGVEFAYNGASREMSLPLKN